MPKWTAFAHAGEYPFDAARLKKQWQSLHAGDAEPLPQDPAVLDAWALFHGGEFQQAAEAGMLAGDAIEPCAKSSSARVWLPASGRPGHSQ